MSTTALQLEIVTPHRVVVRSSVDWVTLPGSEGELGIFPEHVPIMTLLESGVLAYQTEGAQKKMAVHHGYAQVDGNTVSVLVERAETAEEIDYDRARSAEERARESLKGFKNNPEGSHLRKQELKLQRALIRQQASKRPS